MIRRIIKNHYTTELIPKRHEYLKCFLDIVFEQQGQMVSMANFYQTLLKSEKTSTSSRSFHEASLSEYPNPYRYHSIFWKVFKKITSILYQTEQYIFKKLYMIKKNLFLERNGS